MATVYSSYSGGWTPSGSDTSKKYRAGLNYTVTETPTTYTIKARLYVNISSTVNGDFYGYITSKLNEITTRYPSSGYLRGSTVYGDDKTVACGATQTITIAKTTEAQEVTVSATLRSDHTRGSWGSWQTATKVFTVPPMSYTISYDSNGGINPPASQIKEHGIDLELTNDIPSYTGFDFLGWSTDDTATESEYESGDTFSIDEDTTLYAVWHEVYVAPSVNELRAYRVASDASGYNPDVLSIGTRCYVDFLFTEAVSGETEISGTFDEEEVTTVGETGDIRYMYSSNGNLQAYESGTVTVILNTTDYKGNTYSYEYSTFISTENYVWDAFKGTSESEEYGSFAIGGAARDFGNQNRSSKGDFDIYMDMSIVLNDCTITDSGAALSVTAGAGTEDGQLAQAVIDAFDYATAKEILEV